jgi:hypothetical protein
MDVSATDDLTFLGGISGEVHNYLAELVEFLSCEWLGHKISDHLLCWTVFNRYFLALNNVCDIEILDVEVTSTLAATRFAILFKLHS